MKIMDIFRKYFKNNTKIHSIRFKILILFTLSIIIPLVIVGIISSSITADILKNKISEINLQTAIQARENLDFILKEMEGSINKVVHDQEIHKVLINSDSENNTLSSYLKKEAVGKVFRSIFSSRPEVMYMNLSTNDFEIISGIPESDFLENINLYKVDDGKFYSEIKAREKQSYWQDGFKYIQNEALKDCIYYISVIYDEETLKEIGIITVGISKKEVFKSLQENESMNKGLLAIVCGNNPIYCLYDQNGILSNLNIEDISALNETTSKSFEYSYERDKYLVSYDYSKYSEWSIVNIVPIKYLIGSVNNIRTITILAAIICIVFALGFATLLSNKITLPLKKLTKLTLKVKDGSFDIDLSDSNDEKGNKFRKVTDMILGLKVSFRIMLIRSFIITTILPMILLISVLYNASIKIIENEVNNSMMESMDFINKRLNLNMKSAEQSSKYIFTNAQVQSFLLESKNNLILKSKEDEKTAEKIILEELSHKENMTFAGLFSMTGENLYSSTNVYYNKMNVSGEQWYKTLQNSGGECIWFDTYKDNLNRYIISIGRKVFNVLSDSSSVGVDMGYLFVSYSEEFLESNYKSMNLGDKDNFYIINQENKIISNKNKELLGLTINNDIATKTTGDRGSFINTINGQKYLVFYTTSVINKWRLVMQVSLNDILQENRNIFLYNLYILLISLFMIFFISLNLSKRLSKPLIDLQKSMAKVDAGDLSVSIAATSSDEIGDLTRSFVTMVRTLKELIQQVYEIQISKQNAEIKQKDAEMNELQARINPHFLYNTLETINWIAIDILGPNNDISKTVTSLSNLLRSSIDTENKVVFIIKQLNDIENYLFIQKMRYGKKISVLWEIDNTIYDYTALSLIIQPLVENAICHGLESIEENGQVMIKGWEQDGKIYLEVRDDGIGITEEKLKELRNIINSDDKNLSSSSIGLVNTNQRIKSYYGKEFGLFIDSVHGLWTTATIIIPAVKDLPTISKGM